MRLWGAWASLMILPVGVAAAQTLQPPAPTAAPTASSSNGSVAPIAPLASAAPTVFPAPAPTAIAPAIDDTGAPSDGKWSPAIGDVAIEGWRRRFVDAREKMMAGAFAPAAEDFLSLSHDAPTMADRSVVLNLALLCREWDKRGLAFIKKTDLGESSASAKASNTRTSDEIVSLYTNAVFYGIGTGGWVAALAKPDSSAGYILPMLGFAGGSAGIVAAIDSGRPLKYGVAQSIVSGMYLGFEEGFVWTLYNQAATNYRDQWKAPTVATLMWSSATIGAVGGGVIGSLRGTTPGRASYVGSTALWAGLVGGLLGAALSPDDDDQRDDRALLAAGISLNIGAGVGLLTASTVSPSIARVRFLDLGAIVGGLAAGGLYAAGAEKSTKDPRPGLAITGLGIAAGFGAAWVFTRGMPEDRLEDQATSSVVITPSVTPMPGGGTLGLGGLF